jgi:imidazolonepropionase
VYAGDRSLEHTAKLNGRSYAEIHAAGGGIYSTVNAVRSSTQDNLLAESLQRIRQLQKEGVTTLEIKSGYGLDTENEIKMLHAIKSLRKRLDMNIISTFLGAHTIPKDLTQKQYLKQIIDEMLPLIAKEQLADAVDIYAENIAFDNQAIEELFAAAKKYNLPTRIHAEQLSNQQAAATAANLGALSADHLEFLDEKGAKAMADNNTVAVLLPNAFYFLQETQKPPLELLRQYKIPVAVATDTNPGTAPIPSILTALHLSVHLFGMNVSEALLGISSNAAKALGQEAELGSIEIGKQADLGLWDISAPDYLCYQLGGIYPEKIWHKGKLVA